VAKLRINFSRHQREGAHEWGQFPHWNKTGLAICELLHRIRKSRSPAEPGDEAANDRSESEGQPEEREVGRQAEFQRGFEGLRQGHRSTGCERHGRAAQEEEDRTQSNDSHRRGKPLPVPPVNPVAEACKDRHRDANGDRMEEVLESSEY
jgi:hypothetical protein